MAQDCLFCKIFAGEIPAKEVFRDQEIVAFEDIRPVAPTHVLSRMFEVANRIADERKIDRDGYRLVLNKGPQAGQTVYHLHLHLLGGRTMGWPPG
jgi:histidine triad (HIT) family protein